jgi:hypothetical protein
MAQPTAGPLRFTSQLPVDRRSELEDILFFNANQGAYRDAVIQSIEEFGEPRVKSHKGLLRVHTSRLGQVQALYGLMGDPDERLVVAAVFALTAPDTITLIHIGVHPDFAVSGSNAKQMVTIKTVQEIAKAASAIKNVKQVVMPYGNSASVTVALPVRRASRAART